MSHDNHTGENRPNITILSERAVKARLRRKLAHVGFILRTNRPGTLSYKAYGPVHIEEPKGRSIIRYNESLEALARHYEVLADDEQIEGGAK